MFTLQEVQNEELNMEMMLHRIHLSNTSSGIDSMEQSSLHVDTGHSPYMPLVSSPTLNSPSMGHTTGHSVNGLSDHHSSHYGIDLTLDY